VTYTVVYLVGHVGVQHSNAQRYIYIYIYIYIGSEGLPCAKRDNRKRRQKDEDDSETCNIHQCVVIIIILEDVRFCECSESHEPESTAQRVR